MTEEITGPYRFTVRPRPTELGGGWRLRAYEIIPGREKIEMHGGIFPAVASVAGPAAGAGCDDDLAYAPAPAAGRDWRAPLPPPDYRDGEHCMLGWQQARDAATPFGD